jgi:hypothetical protein
MCPRLRFVLDELSREDDDSLRARAMTALARLVLFCLRHAREPSILLARLRRLRDLIEEVRSAPHGVEALQRLWHDILQINDREEPDEVLRLLLGGCLRGWPEDSRTGGPAPASGSRP